MDLPVDADELRRVLRQHGVVYAYVFGSNADGTAGPGSDLDIAVAGPADEWSLRGALPEIVDLTVLEGAPEVLAGRIASRGRVLLDDDPLLACAGRRPCASGTPTSGTAGRSTAGSDGSLRRTCWRTWSPT